MMLTDTTILTDQPYSRRDLLKVAMLACQHLLTGQPDISIFEPEALELAAELLTILAEKEDHSEVSKNA